MIARVCREGSRRCHNGCSWLGNARSGSPGRYSEVLQWGLRTVTMNARVRREGSRVRYNEVSEVNNECPETPGDFQGA